MLKNLSKNCINNIKGGFYYIDFNSGNKCMLYLTDSEKTLLQKLKKERALPLEFDVVNSKLPDCEFTVNSCKGYSWVLDKLAQILIRHGFAPQLKNDFIESFWD